MAIVTILREERDAVLTAASCQNFVPGTAIHYRNQLHPDVYDLVVARSLDRANVPISQLIGNVVEMLRPEFIILSGIAGGVGGREDVQLGDVVVADHVDWYEMRKMEDGSSKIRHQAVDHPSSYLRDTILTRVEYRNAWVAGINVARPKSGTPKMIEGNVIAGDKILGDAKSKYQRAVLTEFDKALAVDMESYGLGRAVYECRGSRRYNLGYLVVRGISDLVDAPNNNQTRKRWRDYAAAAAAAFAIEVADEIIAVEP